ncbi:PaaI family thioesterase [Rhodococcus sp. NPDC019627]|uniref:PaaI family thioesterase n=1 Tax=unclassified Rhodococcus (in: high G+C Gram-positive bacteria) TaxID=192944 RepID=UPI003407667B
MSNESRNSNHRDVGSDTSLQHADRGIRDITATGRVARLEGLAAQLAAPATAGTDWSEIDKHLSELERLTSLGIRDGSVGNETAATESQQRFVPAYEVDFMDEDRVRGRCTFGPFYMGNGEESKQLGSVHGGAIALLFDEVLGWISLRGGKVRTRTAYLKVNFRSMAKVSTELAFAGWTDRIEGRKQFIFGELKDGPTVVAEIDALFVTPKEWHT